jgi:hypothetical protein
MAINAGGFANQIQGSAGVDDPALSPHGIAALRLSAGDLGNEAGTVRSWAAAAIADPGTNRCFRHVQGTALAERGRGSPGWTSAFGVGAGRSFHACINRLAGTDAIPAIGPIGYFLE